ncbi:hypothetical protein B1J94_18570 [Leptospira kirschneri serovar Grippotyphosa]|nr:hypothetical protein B1J94_18570 [Leptospira kirschneri serovar Grippotyphosa]
MQKRLKRRRTQQNVLYGSRLKLKVKYYITFLSCNLLTGVESAVRLSVVSRICPNFLVLN